MGNVYYIHSSMIGEFTNKLERFLESYVDEYDLFMKGAHSSHGFYAIYIRKENAKTTKSR